MCFFLDELLRKNEENHKLQVELDDLKSQLVVAGMTLESDFETQKNKTDEIATLQHLVCGKLYVNNFHRFKYLYKKTIYIINL